MQDPFAGGLPGTLLDAVREFAGLTLEVLPLFLLGAVAGAAVQSFVPERWTARVFGGTGVRALASAVAAGALLPGCSCTTVPLAAGLRGSAAPRLGTVAAFLIAGPLLSPVTVALTWAMLGWELTVSRIAAAIAGSFLFGFVVLRFERWFSVGLSSQRGAVPAPVATSACGCAADEACHCGDCGCGPDGADAQARATCADDGRPRFWPGLRRILRSVTPYFLLGMAIAALISALLPAGALARLLGGSAGPWAYALAGIVGIPLYVCEGEEVPLTFALLAAGLGTGPALTFLLGSVGTCVPTILMSRSVIGRRAVGFYVVYWFVFAIGSGVAFQLIG
ncbi:MAG TPA: permease [Longimicrobiales bacterium]